MQDASVLVTARAPDPKLARAALAPFHKGSGVTETSASGEPSLTCCR